MERRAISVRGIVQGVGFRPFVHGLASGLRLSGFVSNSPAGVLIEVEGDRAALERFERELRDGPPPLARVESVSTHTLAARGDTGFRIVPSIVSDRPDVFICPDIATCDACLRELFDPRDRRYNYPFITCTACGPRLTIVTSSPYDRARTTMAAFGMCEACRDEYEDPHDRRFHAETIACPACGPRLTAVNADGRPIDADPLTAAVDALVSGRIVAIKGLGGFHLACDASDAHVVGELRRRKHRDDKPFAVMAPDPGAVGAICDVTTADAELLTSPPRPIVLIPRRAGSRSAGRTQGPQRPQRDPLRSQPPLHFSSNATRRAVDPAVAPGLHRIGVMLPYTPLHHLLMRRLGGRWLVMTSGNRSDEPIATDSDEALARLSGIADVFLLHDRAIRVRCDDSVVQTVRGTPTPVRRSRGFAPAPIPLPFDCPVPILAVGGHQKNTFAIGRGRHAFVSHHIGDLDEWLAREAFERDLQLYAEMLGTEPSIIAHDLHPDYASSIVAEGMSTTLTAGSTRRSAPTTATQATTLTRVAVQHHHAHVASCMAEHGLTGPVIGVSWDGTGLGMDACIWGGEFLVGDYASVTRAAHLRYVPMPGGDRTAREPWRMALAHQRDADVEGDAIGSDVSDAARRTVDTMVARRINAPLTSSVGRLFDAAASLCGVRQIASFEGQAAMELEAVASTSFDGGHYPFGLDDDLVIDTRPLIRGVIADRLARVEVAAIARRFHTTLVDVIVSVCAQLRTRYGLSRVVLSGGVFLNAILAAEADERLADAAFTVYRHRLVPPGDGGLALGQLAIAAARIGKQPPSTPNTQSN
jgi:hydrogenase maturation protein HypF